MVRGERSSPARQTSDAAEDLLCEHDAYDVYLDRRGELCVRFKNRRGRGARELTAFLARVRVADASPAGYLSSDQRRAWKRMEAAAFVLAFNGDLAGADEALARSTSYVAARAHECAKTWCLLIIGCALALPLIVGICCAFLCGSLPTSFIESRQTYVAQVFLNAVMAGVVGAGFSLLMRLDKLEFRLDSKFALALQAICRLALGAIAACIVVTAIKANFIFGAAILTEGSHVEFWFLFVLAIAAGFLERFVPISWRRPDPEKPSPPCESQFRFRVAWRIPEDSQGRGISQSDDAMIIFRVEAVKLPPNWMAGNAKLAVDLSKLAFNPAPQEQRSLPVPPDVMVEHRLALHVGAGDPTDATWMNQFADSPPEAANFISAAKLRYDLGNFETVGQVVEKAIALKTGRALATGPAFSGHYCVPCAVEFTPGQVDEQVNPLVFQVQPD